MDDSDFKMAGFTRLRDELKALHTPPFNVPGEAEERILSAARLQLPRVRRFRRLTGVAAAAMLLIGAGVLALLPTRATAYARCDVNRDGSVNILDAQALAMAMQSDRNGSPATARAARYDFNGDGRLDRRDVDVVAMNAVRLNERGNP